jgi:TPP-dependent pyruvate/acetoin dehydrogenase alpha subunit
MTRAEMNTIDSKIMAQVQEAVEFAVNSPLPSPEDAWEDIYSR